MGQIKTFYVNGDYEVECLIFGKNRASSLKQLLINLEKVMQELKDEGWKIISVVNSNDYSGGGEYSIVVDSYQAFIVAEKD